MIEQVLEVSDSYPLKSRLELSMLDCFDPGNSPNPGNSPDQAPAHLLCSGGLFNSREGAL